MPVRYAPVFNRNLRLALLPAALLSLTACGTMDALPNGAQPELTAQKQAPSKARSKPVNVIKDGSFEAAATASAWSSDVPGGVRMLGKGAHKGAAWALLGSSEASAETLTQVLTLPKGRARLEFYLFDPATGEGTVEALVDGQPLFSYTSVSAAAESATPEDDDDLEDEDKQEQDRVSASSRSGSEAEDEDEEADDYTAGYEKVKLDVSDFADGQTHTVTFRLTDTSVGTASVSLDDVALEVKLLKELVPAMVQEVQALRLPKAVSQPLVTKLDKATAALARAKSKDAIKELKAFAKEVRSQRGKKIKPAAADTLIQEAQEVIKLVD